MPDCLTGLATVQDISLETSLDYLFNFIINNLGYTCLDYGPGNQSLVCLFFKRQEIIYKFLEDANDKIKQKIVSLQSGFVSILQRRVVGSCQTNSRALFPRDLRPGYL